MRLRYLRERRGISRSTMSELCGLSKSMISKYERGERQPTLEPLMELADFFEVSIDYLCGRK
jgi:transcriptional regulator with XRE-family HTH domain